MVANDRLKKLNPKKELVTKAKKEFGETFDCREAGFILENGTMLDFSGKKEGGTPRTRSLDHRDVCRVIDTGEKGIGGTECMDFFEKQANALRFGLYGTWKRGHDIVTQLNTPQKPTEKQWKRIEKCCRLFKIDAVSYDVFSEKGDRIVSETIEPVANCARVVKQVKTHFEKTKK